MYKLYYVYETTTFLVFCFIQCPKKYPVIEKAKENSNSNLICFYENILKKRLIKICAYSCIFERFIKLIFFISIFLYRETKLKSYNNLKKSPVMLNYS